MKPSSPHMKVIFGSYLTDRLMYLFDGVPNSTSHESKKPSNSSSFLYNCISHHPTTKTSHPPKEFLHQNKIMSTFFFAVFLRLQVQPVAEYSNDDAILQFLRRNLGDGFATKKPMPKENMNSNKSSPTKNGGVFFRWWFSSHKIPIYQQKNHQRKTNTSKWRDSFGGVHPNKTLPTRLMEVENGALQNGETGSIQKRNSPNKKLEDLPPPTSWRCWLKPLQTSSSQMVVILKSWFTNLPWGSLGDLYKNPPQKNTKGNPRHCRQVVIANHYWRPNP